MKVWCCSPCSPNAGFDYKESIVGIIKIEIGIGIAIEKNKK